MCLRITKTSSSLLLTTETSKLQHDTLFSAMPAQIWDFFSFYLQLEPFFTHLLELRNCELETVERQMCIHVNIRP